MATWDGAYNGGGRIEYVYSVGSVSQNTTSVAVSVTAYLRMQGGNSSNGSWPMSWSGAWGSGSSSPSNNIPAGGRVQIRSWSGTVSLTDSTQSRSFQISAQHYWGTTSATLNVSIPARYARTPTGLTVERTSDSRAVIRWTRQGTYTSVGIQFRGNTNGSWGDWVGAGTASGNAASFTKTTGLYANRAYQFRVQGRNSSGASAWSGPSAVIYMTPAAPSSVSATRVAAGILVAVGSMPPHASHFDVWDEATGSVVGSVIPRASFPWTHSSPDPAVPHRYRVRARQNSGGVNSTTLISAYSSYSNTVQLQAPPAAPTNLAPNGGVVAAEASVRYSWRHNPVDSSEQSEYELRYRPVGGAWTTITGAGVDEYHDLSLTAPGSYEWEVRTRGAHATYGPWSATATVTVISVPTVAIITPDDGIWTEPTLTAAWTYDQAEGRPQTGWRVQLTDVDAGDVLVDETGTGSASSFSLPVRLVRSTHYRLRVWVANSGIWSDYDELSFETVFVPPAAPVVDAVWNEAAGSHDLTVDSSVGPEREDIVNLFTNPRLKGDGTWAEVRRNLHHNPGATQAAGWGSFAGDNVRVDSTEPAPWSDSGSARRTTWTTVASDSGDVAIQIGAYLADLSPSVGSIFTIEKRTVVSREGVSLGAPGIVSTGATMVARSRDTPVTPSLGEVVADWLTLEVTGTISPTLRVITSVRAHEAGDWVEQSMGSIYSGEYQGGGFFDGFTMDDSMVQPEDFRVRWLGEPNASESVMEIERVRGMGTTNCIAGVSSWNGRPAMRVISQHSSGASTARIVVPEVARSGGTAIGTLHMREPLTGPHNPNRGEIRINDPVFRSEKSPNEAGSYEHRVVFTALSGAYQSNFFHGGSIGPDVWWTDIGLFAGDYDGPYFDGSSGRLRIDGTAMNAAWDGEPDNSTSRLTMAEPTVRTAIERSIDGGETWELVTESPYVDGELSVSDFEGLSMGTTLYRVTGYSVADEAAEVEVPVVSRSRASWTGPLGGSPVRLPWEPVFNPAPGRRRATFEYEGASSATAYSSHMTMRTVAMSGQVPDQAMSGSASRRDLEAVNLDVAPVHVFRSANGDRVYGVPSVLSLTESGYVDHDGETVTLFSYSFTVTETRR